MSTTLTIKATDLVRNLSSTIDQVRISGRPLLITKGAKTVAELRPPPRVGFPVMRLQELLESLPKLGKAQAAMLRDMAKVRKKTGLPKDPWA
jgi:antitoxin (DNA-binding transcriptional repressor) of toxin-antitoxin stability system